MSTEYEIGGRSAQKVRTREALVAETRRLVGRGMTPSVEEAAEAAGVSRATAYRYFANRNDLLRAAHPEVTTTSMLPPDPPADPSARLDLVVVAFTGMILDTEPQQRTTLRLSLEPETGAVGTLPLRQGRAIRWLGEALEPLRGTLDDAALNRLVLAIRATIGIEALVWLVDVAGLERDEVVELMRSSAQALLRYAVEPGKG